MEIDVKEDRKTQAYKDTILTDIKNVNTFEKRNRVYTTQWRKIYKVIETEF